MTRFDITKTNIAVERLIETTDNPRHLYLLHAYNRHRYLEMAGRWEEIFAPDMTVEKPVYHFNMYGKMHTLEGAEAVQAVYREWTRTSQNVFYTERREGRGRRQHGRVDIDDVSADPRGRSSQRTARLSIPTRCTW